MCGLQSGSFVGYLLCQKQWWLMTKVLLSSDSPVPSKELHFSRNDIGEVSFITHSSSGFNDSMTFQALNRFFDPDYIRKRAYDVSYHGGRGQTMLFTMPHEYIGGLYGPKQDPALVAAATAAAAASAAAASAATAGSGGVGADKSDEGVSTKSVQTYKGLPSYPLCLRVYLRGGLIGKFIKRSFLRWGNFAQRARLEFELTAKLYEDGLPVPRPLLAREVEGTFTFENAIVCEQIPNSKNLAEVLASGRPLSPDELHTIGQTLAHFFVSHVVHTDLNLRNILLDAQGKCYVVDFDKCYCSDKFGAAAIEQMLGRLERSFAKEKQLKNYDFFKVDQVLTAIRSAIKQA